ncbi:MAG: NAD-dependent epimerase/dehydratase family protein [Dermatophilaceae bacterium]
MAVPTVLVTGGTGFTARHCILQLLADGYAVRATLRSAAKEPSARAVLADAGMVEGDRLEFVCADLMDDAGWAQAMAGVSHVRHITSPGRPGSVEDESEVIGPAREGAQRVLRSASGGG